MKRRGRHPKRALTDKIVRDTERAGRYADGGCLYLVVLPAGSKSWVVRTMAAGKRRDLGLGGVGAVTLAKARERAAKIIASAKEDDFDRRLLKIRKRRSAVGLWQEGDHTRVIIESPYKGTAETFGFLHRLEVKKIGNVSYARRCLSDSLNRGESPFASHLLYTQVLDDEIPEQRSLGMKSALAWYDVADLCAVYTDLGISEGMEKGIAYARSRGLTIQERSIEDAS